MFYPSSWYVLASIRFSEIPIEAGSAGFLAMAETDKAVHTEKQPKTETKRIVRLMSTDVSGELSVIRAMRKVKGISFMFANAACTTAGVDKRKKVGQLSESEIKSIENSIRNPQLPQWVLNRRKDPDTGSDTHVTMADLDLKRRDDINLMKRMHTYKGVRHELGQPVRGQRTRSSFRSSGRAMGVSKKKVQQAAKAAAAPPAKGSDKKK